MKTYRVEYAIIIGEIDFSSYLFVGADDLPQAIAIGRSIFPNAYFINARRG